MVKKRTKRKPDQGDMLTLKPNINQLPGNREKGRKKERDGRRRRGIKAWFTFSETQEQKRCARWFCECVSQGIIQQPAHKRGGHEEIIAGAHTHQSLSQHLFLFVYSSVSAFKG